MIYDTAVIGTGPAGPSAALNLKIHNKNIVWIGSSDMSDKISKAELVRNYPGLPEIKGGELAKAFKKHADEMELEITEGVVNSKLSPFVLA